MALIFSQCTPHGVLVGSDSFRSSGDGGKTHHTNTRISNLIKVGGFSGFAAVLFLDNEEDTQKVLSFLNQFECSLTTDLNGLCTELMSFLNTNDISDKIVIHFAGIESEKPVHFHVSNVNHHGDHEYSCRNWQGELQKDSFENGCFIQNGNIVPYIYALKTIMRMDGELQNFKYLKQPASIHDHGRKLLHVTEFAKRYFGSQKGEMVSSGLLDKLSGKIHIWSIDTKGNVEGFGKNQSIKK